MIENDVIEVVGGFIGIAVVAGLSFFLEVRESNTLYNISSFITKSAALEVYVVILGSLIPVSTVFNSCHCR